MCLLLIIFRSQIKNQNTITACYFFNYFQYFARTSLIIFFDDVDKSNIAIKIEDSDSPDSLVLGYTVEWNHKVFEEHNLEPPAGNINTYKQRTALVERLVKNVGDWIEDDDPLFKYTFSKEAVNQYLDEYCNKNNIKREGTELYQ